MALITKSRKNVSKAKMAIQLMSPAEARICLNMIKMVLGIEVLGINSIIPNTSIPD